MNEHNQSFAVQTASPAPPVRHSSEPISGVDINALLSKAVEQGSAMEVVKELRLMQSEMMVWRAKQTFERALARFQSECPVIKKEKAVMNKGGGSVRYHYAPLDSILTQVQPILDRHGFSYKFTTCTTANRVKVICEVKCAGHSETSEFESPIDPQAFMNEQQKFAAALTYAKRYAFCNAFGILTGDEDVDGETRKPKAEGASSIGGAVDDRALKRKLVDLTRDVSGITGYGLTETDKDNITQHLIDECFISPDETLATLAGKRLAEVVAKLEAAK